MRNFGHNPRQGNEEENSINATFPADENTLMKTLREEYR